MYQSAFGVRNRDDITFLSLEAAEDFVLKEYPEHCGSKESAYDLCESMIWEDVISRCGDCDKAILSGDKLDFNSKWCFHEQGGL